MAEDTPFLVLESCADIQRLIDGGVEESLYLDYKASPALARDSKSVDELCKDVTAFANSAGGQLVYGVAEDKKTRKPTDADPGVTDEKITREWIEQVINSRIHPRMSGVRIVQFAAPKGGSVFVVTVPQTQTGPHQAPDKRYYKRFELQSVAMEDYEIRDILNRGVAPDLYVKCSFPNGFEHRLKFKPHMEISENIPITMWVGNRSRTPAEYARILLGIDSELVPSTPVHTFKQRRETTFEGQKCHVFTANWSVLDQRFPIFKEADFQLNEQVMIAVKSDHLHGRSFVIFVGIQAPGFSSFDKYHVRCESAALRMYGPLPKE
ncbi:AlbA family DNA-binding domain-containing protein [Bradyrhizobium genomosp. III]|uniref:AlbA family DNA-binding domain-containing protein n=1 Tax=Bradyrhizobium genomosp. III TaxID=2683271 RepID=UPI000674F55F|nr:ATP-binding protein [Bradyrhizobium sp. CCBAU 15615]